MANTAIAQEVEKVLRRWMFSSKRALVATIINYIQKFNREGANLPLDKTANPIITSVNNPDRTLDTGVL